MNCKVFMDRPLCRWSQRLSIFSKWLSIENRGNYRGSDCYLEFQPASYVCDNNNTIDHRPTYVSASRLSYWPIQVIWFSVTPAQCQCHPRTCRFSRRQRIPQTRQAPFPENGCSAVPRDVKRQVSALAIAETLCPWPCTVNWVLYLKKVHPFYFC